MKPPDNQDACAKTDYSDFLPISGLFHAMVNVSFLKVKFFTLTQSCRITIDNLVSSVNPMYVNLTHNIAKAESGETTFNMTVYYGTEIIKVMALISFNVQKDKNDRNCERELIRTSINICKMAQGVLGDFIAKMIMQDLHKFIDFDMKCPYKKVSRALTCCATVK